MTCLELPGLLPTQEGKGEGDVSVPRAIAAALGTVWLQRGAGDLAPSSVNAGG